MKTTRLVRAMVLGLALGCIGGALLGGAWLAFRPARDCSDLDAETCLALVSADEHFAEGLQFIVLGLALAGPAAGLVWRDAERRARAEPTP